MLISNKHLWFCQLEGEYSHVLFAERRFEWRRNKARRLAPGCHNTAVSSRRSVHGVSAGLRYAANLSLQSHPRIPIVAVCLSGHFPPFPDATAVSVSSIRAAVAHPEPLIICQHQQQPSASQFVQFSLRIVPTQQRNISRPPHTVRIVHIRVPSIQSAPVQRALASAAASFL